MSVARPIPVFHPTVEEFSDFAKYVTSIEPIAEQYGIAKVVPPEGWRARASSYDNLEIEIPCPIRQFVHGKQGVYQVVNVMEKPMSLDQFKQAADEQFAKCFPKSKREGSDPEKFDMEELERRFWKNLTFHAPLYGADMLGSLFEDDNFAPANADEDAAVIHSSSGDQDSTTTERADEEVLSTTTTTTTTTTNSSEGDRDGEEEEEEEEEEIDIETVEAAGRSTKKSPSSSSSPNKRKRSGKESEEKLVQAGEAQHHAWNLGHLDTLLSQRLGKLLPGVTSPYLYFGMWKSLFACHTEDMDLYSINYLHFGKPKIWYGVPSAQKHRVEQVAQLHFPMQFKECSEFLRHKSSIFSPNILKTGNVSLTHAVQQPGEFIITFPGAYHFGFNAGFNCAEAVNFALERWLHFGKKAKPCQCVADSVRIDVGLFISMVANGEEVSPDAIPSPTKRVRTEASSKKPPTKSRAIKRSKQSKLTAPKSPSSHARTMMGARSMGMVTNRMSGIPQLPEPPAFAEETLGDDEATPAFSDDELRSGDEGDGGEYLEGRKKSRRSASRKKQKNPKTESNRDVATDAARSSRKDQKRKQPTEGKRAAAPKSAGKVASQVGEGTIAVATDNSAATPTKKRIAKRRNTTSPQAKQQHTPLQQDVAESVSLREYQGLKIIIRPPKATSADSRIANIVQTVTENGDAAKQVRQKKRSGSTKRDSGKRAKRPQAAQAAEGDTAPRGQPNSETNRMLALGASRLMSSAPEPTVGPSQPSSAPYQLSYMHDIAQQYRASAYSPLVIQSQTSASESRTHLPDGASSEQAFVSQRQKLQELRERQQQLQQHRQEKQQQLQQLNEYIQAQRQLYQQQMHSGVRVPQLTSTVPSPLPYPTVSSYPIGASLPLLSPMPPTAVAQPAMPFVPGFIPSASKPQPYQSILPLPSPHYFVDRPARTTSAEGGKSKLVPILPNPGVASSISNHPHPPIIANSSSTPHQASSLAPTTHPVSS